MIQFWKDDRLQVPAALQLSPNPKLTLDFRFKQAVWTPLLQLTNTKQVNLNTFFEPIVFLEINNRKQVFLNAKLTLDVDCSYQLNNKHRHGDNKLERFGKSKGQFPFDAKECGIELISCEYELWLLLSFRRSLDCRDQLNGSCLESVWAERRGPNVWFGLMRLRFTVCDYWPWGTFFFFILIGRRTLKKTGIDCAFLSWKNCTVYTCRIGRRQSAGRLLNHDRQL